MALIPTLKRTSFIPLCIVVLLCCSPVFAVNGNFYRYSVRHEKATPPYFPFMPVERETVNSANGNLFFTVPLVSRAGRNGLGVDLKLAYNSKIWDHAGGYATLAERDSWVGPGWTLLIGRVIDDSANGYFYVTLSDGSTHSLIFYGGAWRSTDSTYMIYDPANSKLVMKGGLTLFFNYADPLDATIRYATRVRDTNGNYIDIAYTGTGGRIGTILDTVGSSYEFVLDAYGHLQQLKYWNVNDASQPTSIITFTHQSQSFVFGAGEPTDPTLPAQYVLTQVIYPTGLRYQFAHQSSGEVSDITYPAGGHSRYFYTTYVVYDRLMGQQVREHMVTSHDTGAGTGTWTWAYALLYATTITLPDGVTTIVHNMQQSSPGWAEGFPTSSVSYASGSPYAETRQGWTQDDELLTAPRNPRVWRTVKVLKGSPDMTVATEFSFAAVTDYSGNVREIREYSYSSALRRRTFFNYLHETSSAYVPLNIIDRVTETYVFDGSNTLLAKTVVTFDNFVGGIYSAINAIRHDPVYNGTWLTRGLPTMVTRWYDLAHNYTIATSTGYDEAGNPRTITDGRNNTTVIEYRLSSADDSNAFPRRTTNAKGHVTEATYSNWKGGLLLTKTDANGKVTSFQYDSWDRPTLITRPDGGTRQYIYTDSGQPSVEIKDKIDATNYRRRTAKVDALGRLAEETVIDPGGDIKQGIGYESVGQVSTIEYPHRTGQTAYYDSYGYAGAGRLSSISHDGVGTVQYQNSANAKTMTNTDGKRRKYFYQEDGKVSQVLEENDSGQLTQATDYAYDTTGNLATITQGAQTRTFTYDNIGRRLTETHPESGTTTYTYDANGNVLTRSDARGVVTTFVYDELNRVTQKTFSDTTPSVAYTYDVQPTGSPITISNPVGRLTKATTTASGVTASHYYSYCNCSSVDREATVITDGSTRTYTTSYAYNYLGEMTSMTYPNGKVVSYTRDSVGRETRVSSTAGGQAIDYVRSASYLGPQGGLTQIEYGIRYTSWPGTYVQTNLTYSASTLRLTRLETHGLKLDYNYTVPGSYPYQQTGHIYDVTDVYTPANSQHYSYDRWYRLSEYWVSNARSDPYSEKATFAYDRYNNMTGLTYYEPVNCQAGCSSTFAVTSTTNRVSSQTTYPWGTTYFSYDLAGNMTSRGVFDAENRLVSSGSSSFLYDGHSRRLRKLYSATKVYYVYSIRGELLVEDNWTASKKKNHIYFLGRLVATHDQDDYVRILFTDHLGSTRNVVTVTPGTGWETNWVTTEAYDYYPHGGHTSYSGDPQVTPERFTGKPRDESGLDYFGARYYSFTGYPGSFTRWISADSVTAHVYDPQSLNKYTYVRNDPVNAVDPDGRQAQMLICNGGQEIINEDGGFFFSTRFISLCAFINGGNESGAPGEAGGGVGLDSTLSKLVLDETLKRQAELKNYITNLGKGCKAFFGKAVIDALFNQAGSLQFYDVDNNQIANLRNSRFFPGIVPDKTLAEYLGVDAAGAVIVADKYDKYKGTYVPAWSNNIAFRAGLYAPRTGFHELLHIYYQKKDIALAAELRLGSFTDSDRASTEIASFLDKDCQK